MQQKDNRQSKFVPDRNMNLMDQVSQVFRLDYLPQRHKVTPVCLTLCGAGRKTI